MLILRSKYRQNLLKYKKLICPNLKVFFSFFVRIFSCTFRGKDKHTIYIGLESTKIIAFFNANIFFLGVDFLFYTAFLLPRASCSNELEMNVPFYREKPQAFENYRCGTLFIFGDDKREFVT